ncbi:DUF3261 domain-containing protein [Vibrio sp. DW001]|uniref:DUF3261 domain-containing protein n=1 Tax=Vibrio sp. DW001 TaxID=2912315 RepID=UPI0023B06174|nr:DUF3261 domain-containing protein [Vibrio sp. DW001]WED25960.1 DUF3261 domain-containing protein [Vibrio sp. DW001]
MTRLGMTALKISKLTLITYLLLSLFGCTSLQTQPNTLVDIAPNTSVQLPLPKDLQLDITVNQIITAEWNNATHQLPVLLEVDEHSVKLAGFSSWGTRILSLEYTEDKIESEVLAGLGTSLPDPKQVLFYLMITLWPQEVWQTKLDDIGWKLTESAHLRTLLNEQGKEVVIIQYTNINKLAGDIHMSNTISNYRITIQTLSLSQTSI